MTLCTGARARAARRARCTRLYAWRRQRLQRLCATCARASIHPGGSTHARRARHSARASMPGAGSARARRARARLDAGLSAQALAHDEIYFTRRWFIESQLARPLMLQLARRLFSLRARIRQRDYFP